MKCNGAQEYNIPQGTNVIHTQGKGSTINRNDHRQPQTFPLIREGQTQSPEANVPNLFSMPDSQSIRNSPFQAGISSSNSPGVTPSPERYVSANSPGEAPSTGRDLFPRNTEVTPSQGSYVSLSSHGFTPSPGKHVSPISPGVKPSSERGVPPSSPDITPSAGKNASPRSVAPSQSPCTSGVAPSPRRDNSSHSEVETNTSDSVSLGSLSPERPVRQNCKFCEQSPSRGHTSESSLSESTSSSSSQPTTSSYGFCQEDEERLSKVDDSHPMIDQNLDRHMQYVNKPSLETHRTKGIVHNGTPNGNPFSKMGLCAFDSDNRYNKEGHTSSNFHQQIGSSVSSSLSHQDKIINQAGSVRNARMDTEIQHSKGSAMDYNKALPSNQHHSPRDQSGIGQGSVSPHVVGASQITKEERLLVSSGAKMSPVPEHHQSAFPPQNEKKSSDTSPLPSKPLSPSSATVSPSVVSVAPSASNTVRPLMQKPLCSNPPHWPGQHQNIHPLLANLMISRFQQPDFPRHQFGNTPFVPPGVLNPAMLQGWDRNALLQQQLLASRLPFGQPFQTGGQHLWPGVGPRGPVQNPVQGYRPPVGRHDVALAGRRRPFAPRFHSPGGVQIRTHGDLEKLQDTPEQRLPVANTLETKQDSTESNRSTSSDAQTSNMNLSLSVGSCAAKLSSGFSSTSDLPPKSISDKMPKESSEKTGCQGFSCSQEPGKKRRDSGEGQLLAPSPTSALQKQEGDLESTGTTKAPPSKMSPSELLLKEQKVNA